MENNRPPHDRHRRHGGYLWGTVLIALGVIFFFQNVFHIAIFSQIWPLILVAFGIALIFEQRAS
jgi:hypothetical protein